MIGYGEALGRLNPDMVVVLGDRFETFCMAAATQVCRVPLTHIHGGETTEGAIDEAFRHLSMPSTPSCPRIGIACPNP